MGRITFLPTTQRVEIGGRSFTVSALPCGLMRREVTPLVQRLQSGGNLLSDENFDPMLKLCLASVTVAEPGLTREDLEDGLLITDIAALFSKVVEVSGLGGREHPEGEAPSPSSQSNSGDGFTGSSSPLPDGPSEPSTQS